MAAFRGGMRISASDRRTVAIYEFVSHQKVCCVGVLGLALFSAPVSPAHALTMKECSAKYQAAKSAGTLGGMKWSDFRRENPRLANSFGEDTAARERHSIGSGYGDAQDLPLA
jgi:hypothetical protein